MKARYEAYNSLSFEIEGDKLPTILKELASIREAIAWEPCGKCRSDNTFPNHREVDGTHFYELKCQEPKCGAVLQLGTHKDGGTLYKKKMKTDDKGKAVKVDDKAQYLLDNGWLKWNPNTQKME